MATTYDAVSLFSNCGAGDVGFSKAGFKFHVIADVEARRLEVAGKNLKGACAVKGDLRLTWKTVVARTRERLKGRRLTLLAACPPCQGMSTMRSDRGSEGNAAAGSRDKRNLLVTVISDVALALLPDFVVVENVVAFFTRKVRHPQTKKGIAAARLLIQGLAHHYEVFPFLSDLADYGVPQTRKRAFLVFIRRGHRALKALRDKKCVPYPIPSHADDWDGEHMTVGRALARYKFARLDARSEASARSATKALHFVPVWADRRYEMVAAVPPGSGLGAWNNNRCEKCGAVFRNLRKMDAMCPDCGGPLLRPVVEKRRGGYRLIRGFMRTAYTRMNPNRPAATITTASGHVGSSHTIHPFENRVLSPLECARLQTFPARFKWGQALKKLGHSNIRQMIGEAVPPLFTRKLGNSLAMLMEERVGKLLPDSDRRYKKARIRLLLDLH